MNARQKRSINEAKEILWRHDIKFALANGELHFLISHQCRRIDFWPTTGKWIARGARDISGKGIDALLDYIAGNGNFPAREPVAAGDQRPRWKPWWARDRSASGAR